MPRAKNTLSAPSGRKKQLPGAEKALSAPGIGEKQFERSEAPSGACREKGEGRREERCDDRKAPGAKAFGGRRPTEGGRQSRAGEPRNASKNAGVDAVSEGTSPLLNINELNVMVANKDTFFVLCVRRKWGGQVQFFASFS